MSGRREYIFLLNRPNRDAALMAKKYLEELGVKVLIQQRDGALIAMAKPEHVDSASSTGLFSNISCQGFSRELFEDLSSDQIDVAKTWNHVLSARSDKKNGNAQTLLMTGLANGKN